MKIVLIVGTNEDYSGTVDDVLLAICSNIFVTNCYVPCLLHDNCPKTWAIRIKNQEQSFKSNEHSIIYDSLNLRQLFRTSHHVDSW